ncbi:hypothetical protein OJAV_G00009200 [Oryzias javanicus]|uniref:Reverse transcriptase/retrotransposon-derived protein RNase H-like domain-containing protein n=1 Tax=Oryzias javanicus TaxID=123683 RepID=A0A437DNZ9_ORYJA|nr:hypothetical protein OJAV_G00009200 [Oryzias javanicus]
MDRSKVEAVLSWPVPVSRKHLQRFLGFANFYRKFIKGFSKIAAPLHSLTSTKRRFVWTSEADESFKTLKDRFSSAPVLLIPNEEKQFILEVDASDHGVGAVLSQRSDEDNKVHPCAFFSRRLSSAERNYDVGDRELLSIKLAFEEWRHWLEGAKHPFAVFTDHKNLEYLRSAKSLLPWCAAFLDWTHVYDPGLDYSRFFSAPPISIWTPRNLLSWRLPCASGSNEVSTPP